VAAAAAAASAADFLAAESLARRDGLLAGRRDDGHGRLSTAGAAGAERPWAGGGVDGFETPGGPGPGPGGPPRFPVGPALRAGPGAAGAYHRGP
jgi:hypothetical protein